MSATTAIAPDVGRDVQEALAELTEVVAEETADTGQYRYKYATLAAVMRAVRPTLARHHLSVSQRLAGDQGTMAVCTVLVHSSGVEHSSGWLTVTAPPSAQQLGSWVSYLRRYQLVALLGLAIEDDDGKSAGTPPPLPARAQRPQGESSPGPMGPGQRTLVQTLFRQLGLEGEEYAEERAAYIAEVVGDRGLNSTTAGELIAALRDRVHDMEDRNGR